LDGTQPRFRHVPPNNHRSMMAIRQSSISLLITELPEPAPTMIRSYFSLVTTSALQLVLAELLCGRHRPDPADRLVPARHLGRRSRELVSVAVAARSRPRRRHDAPGHPAAPTRHGRSATRPA